MPTTVTQTLNFTGSVQSINLPGNMTGNVIIDIYGAGGGGGSNSTSSRGVGGSGGGFRVVFPVPAFFQAATLNCFVGGAGFNGSTQSFQAVPGGYNGGGNGGYYYGGLSNGSGGGMTDIRLNGMAFSDIILACGGGGGGASGKTGVSVYNLNGGSAASTYTNNASSGDSYGSATAGGGATTSGPGTAGTGSVNGSPGSAGKGGNGANAPAGNYPSSGGGGGAGYNGGGGGAAGGTPSTGFSSAGGGSCFVLSSLNISNTSSFVSRPSGGYTNSAPDDGYITITYTTKDPVVGGVVMNSSGGLTPTRQETRPSVVGLATTAGLTLNSLVLPTSPNSMMAQGKLLSIPAPGLIPSAASFTAQANLDLDGFRSFAGTVNLAAVGGFTIQQTLSGLSLRVDAELDLDASQSLTYPTIFAATGQLDLSATRNIPGVRNIIVYASMVAGTTTYRMAALNLSVKGSVSLVGNQTSFRATPMLAKALMSLRGQRTAIGQVPIFVAAAVLDIPAALRPTHGIGINTFASMTVGHAQLELVSHFMRAYGSLTMSHYELSRVLNMQAIAALFTELEESGGTLEPPYLTIVDAHNTVQFFADSYPDPRALRQRVTNVKSGF